LDGGLKHLWQRVLKLLLNGTNQGGNNINFDIFMII